uniref:Uncharacterized protein n=1 Tax=Romanomermis culicivorax TaxID=13658 RepID=A0A915HDH8_ROMCU
MKRIHSSKNRGGQHVKTVIYQQGSAESADYCCLRLYDMTAFKSYSSRIHYNVDMELINCENDATQDECFESPKETVFTSMIASILLSIDPSAAEE